MTQALFGGYGFANPSTVNASYNAVSSGGGWTAGALEYTRTQLVATPGTISRLLVKLSSAPGLGKSYTITVRKNGVDTGLTCIISGAETIGSDIVNTIPVVAGDRLSLKQTPNGGPAATHIYWSTVFEPTMLGESLLLGVGAGDKLVDNYIRASGAYGISTITETSTWQVLPVAGTIKSLFIRLSQSPGVLPDGYRFTLRVNGVSTSLTCTITAPATTGSNTIDAIVVSAGDCIDIFVEPLNLPANNVTVQMGLAFVPDGAHVVGLVLGSERFGLSAIDTEYNALLTPNYNWSWGVTEAGFEILGQTCKLSGLYILLENAPGIGKSFTFTLRVNGVSVPLSVTISNMNTTGSDFGHQVSISDNDFVTIMCVPSGNPAVGRDYWGCVISELIAPSVTTLQATEVT